MVGIASKMDEEASRPFILALPKGITQPSCAYETILPDDHFCPKPGIRVEWLLFILSLFHRNPRIKVIQASGFSFTDKTENDTSVMGLLLSGKADISPPIMYLTYDRAELLPHTTPFYHDSMVLIYRNPKDFIIPALDYWKLLPVPYTLFASLLLISYMLRKMFSKMSFSFQSKSQMLKRSELILDLAFVIFLGCIGSHVVMIFNLPAPKLPKPIKNINDVLKATESGEFKVIVGSKIFIQHVFNPVKYANKSYLLRSFVAASAKNPPLLINSRKELVNLLLSDRNRVAVLSASSNIDGDISYLDKKCSLHFVNEPDYEIGSTVIYMSKSWRLGKKLNQIQIKLIHEELKILQSKYLLKSKCYKDQMPKYSSDPTVAIEQMQGVFWLMAILHALTVLVGCAEIFWKRVTVCVKQKGKMVPSPNGHELEKSATETEEGWNGTDKNKHHHCYCHGDSL